MIENYKSKEIKVETLLFDGYNNQEIINFMEGYDCYEYEEKIVPKYLIGDKTEEITIYKHQIHYWELRILQVGNVIVKFNEKDIMVLESWRYLELLFNKIKEEK